MNKHRQTFSDMKINSISTHMFPYKYEKNIPAFSKQLILKYKSCLTCIHSVNSDFKFLHYSALALYTL